MRKILLAILLLIGMSSQSQAIVTNTINKNILACNGVLTTFQYTFPIIDITNATDLQVSQFDNVGNQTVLTTNYSVNTTTGTVTYPVSGTACPTGYTIVLLRVEPITQGVAASYQGPGPTPPVMNMADKNTMISQQLNEAIGRALLLPLNSSGGATFPGSQPGYLVGWNGSGVLSNILNPSLVAQWSLNGANISYNTGNVSTTNNFSAGTINSTGNVGIGSTSPGQALDVTGTIRTQNITISAGSPVNGSILTATDNSGDTSWSAPISSGWTVSGNNVYPSGSGNVGIGSITPGQRLDVVGTVRASYLSLPANAFSSTGINWTSINNYFGSGSTFAPSSNLKVAFGSIATSENASTTQITNLPFTSASSYTVTTSPQENGTTGVCVEQNSGMTASSFYLISKNGMVCTWIAVGY